MEYLICESIPDGHQNANYMTIRLEYDKITSPNTGENNNNNNSGNNGNSTQKNVSDEEVKKVIDKLPGADFNVFKQNIESAKRGATQDLHYFMTNNNQVFGENLNQSQADTLCDYVRQQTGLDYTITINTTYANYDSTPETINNYDLNTSYEYKDRKFIIDGIIKASDNWGNAWDISPYIQIYDQDNNQWQGLWWDHAEVPVIHNGHYILVIGLYGSNFLKSYECDVTDIDTEKPKIKYVTQIVPPEKSDGTGAAIEIKVTDNVGLKSVNIESLEDKMQPRTINIDGDKEKVIEQAGFQAGKYKVMVEDKSGNKEEKEVYIKEIDNEVPKYIGMPAITVVGNSNPPTYKNMPIVKKGDKVKIEIKANEKIKSIGNPNGGNGVADNGAYQLTNGIYKLVGKYEMQKVNSQTIPIEIEITDELIDLLNCEGSSGNIGIKVFYVRDEYNNKTEFEFENLFIVDDSTPELKSSRLASSKTNGRSYTDKNGNKYMFIEDGKKLKMRLVFNEALGKNPNIKIGNTIIEAKQEKQINIDLINSFVYYAELDGSKLIKGGNIPKNDVVPITITNIVDKVNHRAEDITIDIEHKTSDGYCLYYGIVKDETLFFAGAEITNTPQMGDINADGIINNYDNLLMSLHSDGVQKLKNDELERAYLSEDKKIDSKSFKLLEEKINKQINYIFVNKNNDDKLKRGFKIYDVENTQVDVDNLTCTIKDAKGKDITNEFQIIKDTTNNVITFNITEKQQMVNPVTIEVANNDTNENVKRLGTIKLIVADENFSSDGYIYVDGLNKTGNDILGDINNDGYITLYDGYMAMLADVEKITLTQNELKRGDINNDGIVDTEDALLILRANAGIGDGLIFSEGNTLERSESVQLVFSDDELNDHRDNMNWELIEGDEAFTLSENGKLTVKDEDGLDGTMAIVKATHTYTNMDTGNTGTEVAVMYWTFVNKVNLNIQNESIQIELPDNNEQTAEESNEPIIDITAIPNIDNKKIEYSIEEMKKNTEELTEENDVAKLVKDDFGNVKLLAKSSGETTIAVVEDGGTKKEINVNITKGIESISVNKDSISVRQGQQTEFTVTVNPSEATEEVQVVSDNTGVATVSYDKESKTCKVSGVQEGNTTIEVYSPGNSEIKKTINVHVDKQETPTITKIVIENSEKGKVYKVGDELYIRVNFNGALEGTVPELKLKFGDYQSKNKAQFVESLENKTVIRYKYIVAEGDNGELMVEQLSGGILTDTTKNITAITSKDSDVFNEIQEANLDKEYINDSIYEKMEDITADTEKPAVRVETNVSKYTNWLKNGDEIKVKIVAEESLKGVPTVLFNGKEAKVEGEGSIFIASMQVTKDLADGYLEIKIDNIVDAAGNTKEAVVAKEDNIDYPIIIDNSAPIISAIKIKKEEGKELTPGETVNIQVDFSDAANVTKEYIMSKDSPVLDIKFDGKAAQGRATSYYDVGKYVQSIKYTYTVAEGDNGEISVDGISGIVTDVAGNETDLSKVKVVNKQNQNQSQEQEQNQSQEQNQNQSQEQEQNQSQEQEQNQSQEQNQNQSQEKDKTNEIEIKTFENIKKSPKTGDNVLIYGCILLVTIGIEVFVIECKNKSNS